MPNAFDCIDHRCTCTCTCVEFCSKSEVRQAPVSDAQPKRWRERDDLSQAFSAARQAYPFLSGMSQTCLECCALGWRRSGPLWRHRLCTMLVGAAMHCFATALCHALLCFVQGCLSTPNDARRLDWRFPSEYTESRVCRSTGRGLKRLLNVAASAELS